MREENKEPEGKKETTPCQPVARPLAELPIFYYEKIMEEDVTRDKNLAIMFSGNPELQYLKRDLEADYKRFRQCWMWARDTMDECPPVRREWKRYDDLITASDPDQTEALKALMEFEDTEIHSPLELWHKSNLTNDGGTVALEWRIRHGFDVFKTFDAQMQGASPPEIRGWSHRGRENLL